MNTGQGRLLVVPEGCLSGEDTLTLDREFCRHLKDVLRLEVGDPLRLCDGAGRMAPATIEAFSRHAVVLRLGASFRVAIEEVPLILIQSVGKGHKMDQVVRQATELGVHEIVPVRTQRTVGVWASRLPRWRAIREDALRISGRAHRPRLEDIVELEAVWSRPRACLSLCFSLEATQSLRERLTLVPQPPKGVELLVGPEGGLSPSETEAAREAGFGVVHLGPHTFRTETAGTVALAILQYWLGHFDTPWGGTVSGPMSLQNGLDHSTATRTV